MSSPEQTTVKSLLGYKLKATQHRLRLQMDEAMRVLDLTTPQYSVLAQLELKPGQSSAALARNAFITAQTMQGIISNLEKRGLIERTSDPNHGRVLAVELTLAGTLLVQKAHASIRAVEAKMTATFDADKRKILEQLLQECFDNLNP